MTRNFFFWLYKFFCKNIVLINQRVEHITSVINGIPGRINKILQASLHLAVLRVITETRIRSHPSNLLGNTLERTEYLIQIMFALVKLRCFKMRVELCFLTKKTNIESIAKSMIELVRESRVTSTCKRLGIFCKNLEGAGIRVNT